MKSFKCPVCYEVISGEDEDDLTKKFSDHFATVHKVDVPSVRSGMTDMGKGDLAFGAAPSIQDPNEEGAFGAESHSRAHEEMREKEGTAGPLEAISVRCPFCDTRIMGANGEAVTDELKSHLVLKHNMVVRAQAC